MAIYAVPMIIAVRLYETSMWLSCVLVSQAEAKRAILIQLPIIYNMVKCLAT